MERIRNLDITRVTGAVMKIKDLDLKRLALLVVMLALGLTVVYKSTNAFQRTETLATAAVVGTPVSLGEITVTAEREIASESNALNKTNNLKASASVNRNEVLWLARVIYSETKRPHEQELVAWVVRNRVETGYRGKRTYQSVVLDPWQFSAFNRNSPKRSHYSNLQWNSKADGFQTALQIAERVVGATPTERPFSETTRHFFSRQSMVGGRYPAWAHAKQPVKLTHDVEPDRFRFYDKVM